jgi:hypothetical protein
MACIWGTVLDPECAACLFGEIELALSDFWRTFITTHGVPLCAYPNLQVSFQRALGIIFRIPDSWTRLCLGVAELEHEWCSPHLVCGSRPALPCRSPGACFASRSEVQVELLSSTESGLRRNELNYGQFKRVKIDTGSATFSGWLRV